MSDLISRNVAIEEFCKNAMCNAPYCTYPCDAVRLLRTIPVVDAAPVVHGYWQEVTANELYGSGSYAVAGYVCSHCGFDIETADYETYNFCPCCGAIMSPDKTQI